MTSGSLTRSSLARRSEAPAGGPGSPIHTGHYRPPVRRRIRGFAGYYWRGKEPTDIPDQAIELELDAWVISDAAAERLSPAQAVDAALSDPSFAAYLQTQKIADGRAEIAWYDADRDLWEIGVMPWYETEPPRIHGVLVDAVTGRILGSLDRPWDEDVDPFPMN